MDESILVVDDEKSILMLLESVFKVEQFEVYTASDGTSAIEVFAKHQNQISLVLTDVNMPGISGVELMQEIKNISPSTTVCLMTGGSVDPSDFPDWQELGAYEIFQKPFYSMSDLVGRIREILADHRKKGP